MARNQCVVLGEGVYILLPEWPATAVPLRPIVAVYHHVKRVYHPLRGQGKWSIEQDTLLEQCATPTTPDYSLTINYLTLGPSTS